MAPDPPELTSISRALRDFAFPPGNVQSSLHIRRLHWYVACRLVIEGGFDPRLVKPRPPLRFTEEKNALLLHHDPESAKGGERTLLGGLKTKQMDVTVVQPGIGPVLSVSLKGTHNAIRNLTNRMEEAAGDCTNLHMAYPAMVYGFWHLVRANEETDEAADAHFELDASGRYKTADIAVTADQNMASGLERYAQALERLSDREDLRDSPSRYEACGLTLVNARGGRAAVGVHPVSPRPGEVLEFNRMFSRLFNLYDERFVYQAPTLRPRTQRLQWDAASPLLQDTVLSGGAFDEMSPRIA